MAALALAIVLTIVAAACGGTTQGGSSSASSTTTPPANKVGGTTAGPPDSPAADGGKVVYGIDAEPEGLDPSRYAFSQAGHAVASAVFEPLATLDADGNAVPYLATAFDASPDKKTWTITLPTGVTYHDGTPFNAAAAVTVLKAYQQSAIDGSALVAIDTFTATDPTHVTVALKKPLANLPALFTTQAGYMISPAMLSDQEVAKKPAGTGPFVFERHEDGKIWSFTKNANYRQKGLPHLDAIDFVPVIDPVERNNQLRKGDLDVLQTNVGPQILDLRSSDFKQVENPRGDKSFLMVNTTKAPFDNVIARRAAARATDASKWRKDVQADVASAANSPYGPGQPGYIKDNAYPSFDMAEAQKLVKQYETETGQPFAFTFLVSEDNANLAIGQTFAAAFQEAGMKVTLEQKPQINLLAGVAIGQYQMSQFRVFASPNPDADVHFYRSPPPGASISLNFPRYSNPEVDAAIDTAIATTDDAARNTAYEKVNKIFAEQVPFLWLGQNDWMLAANPKVNGIYPAANGSIATVGPKTWIAGLSKNR